MASSQPVLGFGTGFSYSFSNDQYIMERDGMENLTKDVLLYNQLRCTVKNPLHCKRIIMLEKSILQRCHILMYRVPAETKLLDQEVCAEFLLASMPYVLTIIRNFKNQGVPFEAYLRKIIRTRARTFYSEKKVSRNKERTLLYCCGQEIDGIVIPTLNPCGNRQENTNMEGVDIFSPRQEDYEQWNLYSRYHALKHPPKKQRGSSALTYPPVEFPYMTAEATLQYGVATKRSPRKRMTAEINAQLLFKKLYACPTDTHEKTQCKASKKENSLRGRLKEDYSESLLRMENPAAARLQQEMKNPTQRKRLLTLLLASPEQVTPAMINHLSSIMDIDELDLAGLVRTANSMIFQKQMKQKEMQRVINGHWKRRIWLDQQLYTLKSASSYDLAQCLKLEAERNRTRHVLRERREERARSPQGLSSMQLAQLLGVPKGTVCSGMFYARKMLQECLSQECEHEPQNGDAAHIAGE